MVRHDILTFGFMVISIAADLTSSGIRCPDPAQWHLRAKGYCNVSFPSYVCLLDDNNNRIIETCEKKQDFQTPGYKFVIRGGYDGKPCDSDRYQPFTFWTDGNSDCVFSKSKCDEEGQVYSDLGSTTTDLSCRCDNTKGYAYVTKPSNLSACQPSVEDCSCYFKGCKFNQVLADDYTCTIIDTTNEEAKLQPVEHVEEEWSKNEAAAVSQHIRGGINEQVETFTRRNNRLFLIGIITITLALLSAMIYVLLRCEECMVEERKDDTYEFVYEKLKFQIQRRNTFHSRIMKALLEEHETHVIVTIISEFDDLRSSFFNELKNRYNYAIVCSSFKLQELAKTISNTGKYVIVITDMFENDTKDVRVVRRWHNLFIYLNFQDNVKLFLLCKPHVFQTYLFQNIRFLSDTIFDLDLQTMFYNGKYNIDDPRLYLTSQEIQNVSSFPFGESWDFFLILCKRYAWKRVRNEVKSIETFFSDYDTAIKEDICLQRADKSTIVAIMMIIINNNCLAFNKLSSKNLRTTNILLYLSTLPEIGQPISSNDIRDELEILSRSYVEKSEQYYSISNTKLRRIFVSFYAEHFLPSLIQLAGPEVIRDSFVFSSIRVLKYNVIYVPSNYETMYMDRLSLDIRSGLVSQVLNNIQMEHVLFRTKFVEHLTKDDATIAILNSLSHQVVSPLLAIAEKGYCEMARYFVTHKFPIDVKNMNGSTPLFLACQNNQVEMVEYLLSKHADYNICNNEGITPLFVACENGCVQTVKLLLEYGSNANWHKNIYTIRNLNNNKQILYHSISEIDTDTDINSNILQTPLYVATVAGYDDIVNLLIENKVDVNECSMSNRTPLHAAIETCNIQIVELLLRYRCKMDVFDNSNETPLHIAVRKGYSDIVAILLRNGASPYIGLASNESVYNTWDSSIIRMVLESGNSQMLKLLLRYGSDNSLCDSSISDDTVV